MIQLTVIEVTVTRLLTVACASLLSVALWANQLEFSGKAFHQESGELLYLERHVIDLNTQGEYVKGHVTYFDAHGSVIANKTMNYTGSPTLPHTQFKEVLGPLQFEAKAQEREVKLQFKDDTQHHDTYVKMMGGLPNVIDGGFDRLVYENWSKLMNREVLEFSFLAVSRADFYRFELETQSIKNDRLVLKLSPASTILSWLLDPAYLTYDIPSKRLLEFKGLTNIRKHVDGQVLDENYVAHIQYEYF